MTNASNPANLIKTLEELLDADNENGYYYSLIRNCLVAEENATISFSDYLESFDPDNEMGLTREHFNEVTKIIHDAFNDPRHRDGLTHLAMGLSLCPIHFVDWAICFDDDDPSCAQVRHIFPHSHDT